MMWAQTIAYLAQGSTIAGLSAIGLLFGLPAGTVNLAGQAFLALAGLLGVLLDANKTAAAVKPTETVKVEMPVAVVKPDLVSGP